MLPVWNYAFCVELCFLFGTYATCVAVRLLCRNRMKVPSASRLNDEGSGTAPTEILTPESSYAQLTTMRREECVKNGPRANRAQPQLTALVFWSKNRNPMKFIALNENAAEPLRFWVASTLSVSLTQNSRASRKPPDTSGLFTLQ